MTTLVALVGVVGVLWAVRAFAGRPVDRDAEPFVPVADEAEVERLVAASNEAPVVLFLHDPYCPVSGGAYRKMKMVRADVHLVDVSRQVGLNRAIAARTGLRHESPQVIVLRDGAPVYDASHGRISAAEVEEAAAFTDAAPREPGD